RSPELIRRPPSSTLLPYTTLFRSFAFLHVPEVGLLQAAKDLFQWQINRPGGQRSGLQFLQTALFIRKRFLAARVDHPHMRHPEGERKSKRLNSSHLVISYAVFCL